MQRAPPAPPFARGPPGGSGGPLMPPPGMGMGRGGMNMPMGGPPGIGGMGMGRGMPMPPMGMGGPNTMMQQPMGGMGGMQPGPMGAPPRPMQPMPLPPMQQQPLTRMPATAPPSVLQGPSILAAPSANGAGPGPSRLPMVMGSGGALAGASGTRYDRDGHEIPENSTTVFVGKLDVVVENDFIEGLMECCGAVVKWTRKRNPSSGKAMAFGFCEFEACESVTKAIRAVNGKKIAGKELLVKAEDKVKEYALHWVEMRRTERARLIVTAAMQILTDPAAPQTKEEKADLLAVCVDTVRKGKIWVMPRASPKHAEGAGEDGAAAAEGQKDEEMPPAFPIPEANGVNGEAGGASGTAEKVSGVVPEKEAKEQKEKEEADKAKDSEGVWLKFLGVAEKYKALKPAAPGLLPGSTGGQPHEDLIKWVQEQLKDDFERELLNCEASVQTFLTRNAERNDKYTKMAGGAGPSTAGAVASSSAGAAGGEDKERPRTSSERDRDGTRGRTDREREREGSQGARRHAVPESHARGERISVSVGRSSVHSRDSKGGGRRSRWDDKEKDKDRSRSRGSERDRDRLKKEEGGEKGSVRERDRDLWKKEQEERQAISGRKRETSEERERRIESVRPSECGLPSGYRPSRREKNRLEKLRELDRQRDSEYVRRERSWRSIETSFARFETREKEQEEDAEKMKAKFREMKKDLSDLGSFDSVFRWSGRERDYKRHRRTEIEDDEDDRKAEKAVLREKEEAERKKNEEEQARKKQEEEERQRKEQEEAQKKELERLRREEEKAEEERKRREREERDRRRVEEDEKNRARMRNLFGSSADEDDFDKKHRPLQRLEVHLDKKNIEAQEAEKHKKLAEMKQILDSVPQDRESVFALEVLWDLLEEHGTLEKKVRPWMIKKVVEFLGDEHASQQLCEALMKKIRARTPPATVAEELRQVLDEDAEAFIVKLWRMIVFEQRHIQFLANKARQQQQEV